MSLLLQVRHSQKLLAARAPAVSAASIGTAQSAGAKRTDDAELRGLQPYL